MSFDVVSLFTRVPVRESCGIIGELLNNDSTLHQKTCLSPAEITELLLFFLERTYLQVSEAEFFRQREGCAMGKSPSPVVADLYMSFLETGALASFPLVPKLIARLVDDYFIVWQHGRDRLQLFFNHFNNQHENIKFTMEIENDGSLPFLDVLVTRNTSVRGFATTVYRKPSNSGQFIPYTSFHPFQHKSAAIKALTYRAISHCSSLNNCSKELQTIYSLFRNKIFQLQLSMKQCTQLSVQNPSLCLQLPLTNGSWSQSLFWVPLARF